ncbi:MAG: glycosyltransferase family 1 protein [Gemmatimonadetes bacterium]|nr:glycosyltransferase family 1 protein [Gemmatimonadota bacterium]
MRLVLVTATPNSVAQGSGTHVAACNLQAGLEALGHEVQVLAPRGLLAARTDPFSRILSNILFSRADVGRCDLLVGLDLDGWLLAGRVAAPYVAWLHGVIADEARFERGLPRLSLGVQGMAERAAARRAAMVLALSEYSAGRVAALYRVPASRIRVVHPGFDVTRWQKALASVASVAPVDRLCVLSVGHMYPRKNHAALLRAAAVLKPAFPDLAVRIVGDGPERAHLVAQSARLKLGGTVTFLGHLPFTALAEEYARSHIFCLPSLQEGFGMVFAEAMTAGKPIVACRAGATPEVVVHEHNGYLVPAGDDLALADALATLLRDPALRLRMGDSSRQEAVRRFGLEPAAKRFLEAVAPLL